MKTHDTYPYWYLSLLLNVLTFYVGTYFTFELLFNLDMPIWFSLSSAYLTGFLMFFLLIVEWCILSKEKKVKK